MQLQRKEKERYRKGQRVTVEADHGRHIWNVVVGNHSQSQAKPMEVFSSLGFPQREKMTAQLLERERERESFESGKQRVKL